MASALEAVYDRLAPQATRYVPSPPRDREDPRLTAMFSALETRTYDWSRALSTEEWVGMVTTFNDHQRLGPARLIALQRAIGAAIETLGGTVRARAGTYVGLNRRA